MAEPFEPASLHPAEPAEKRLRVLEQMLDQGLISQAEYEALRAEILDEL
jgi:membrane peptidoglycan carboxypeptidase